MPEYKKYDSWDHEWIITGDSSGINISQFRLFNSHNARKLALLLNSGKVDLKKKKIVAGNLSEKKLDGPNKKQDDED
jgi:hypothetical protein